MRTNSKTTPIRETPSQTKTQAGTHQWHGRPENRKPVRPEKHGQEVWGAYIPSIKRSYPDLPIKGTVIDGKSGKEFRPLDQKLLPDRRASLQIKDWAIGRSYDGVVQMMREYADEAIKERNAEIARLDRFIREN